MEILTCFSCRLSLFTIMKWQSVKKGGKGKDHLLVFLCVPVLARVLGRKLDCLLAGFLQSEFFLTGSCFKTNRKILFAVSWSSIACIISNMPVSGSYTSQLWKKLVSPDTAGCSKKVLILYWIACWPQRMLFIPGYFPCCLTVSWP